MKKATLFFLVFIILAFVAGYFLAKQDLFSTVDEPVLQEDDTQTNSVEFYDYSKNKLEELLFITDLEDGTTLYNGVAKEERAFYQVGHLSKIIIDGKDKMSKRIVVLRP